MNQMTSIKKLQNSRILLTLKPRWGSFAPFMSGPLWECNDWSSMSGPGTVSLQREEESLQRLQQHAALRTERQSCRQLQSPVTLTHWTAGASLWQKQSAESESWVKTHRVIWSPGHNIDIQDWRTVISSSDLVTQSRGGNFSQVESESSRWVLHSENVQMWGKYFLLGKMCS